ncbi:MAG: hypothetical protein DMF89_00635 [Acidobacteria bacterium]|nr:MAG: hypothetical protein DMF89_00635 [Acidobacteriota bacterium]
MPVGTTHLSLSVTGPTFLCGNPWHGDADSRKRRQVDAAVLDCAAARLSGRWRRGALALARASARLYTQHASMPRQLLVAAVLSLGVSVSSSVGAAASDWPRFRGPNGSGVADSAVPTEFGPGKNIDWRIELPFGRSSPIVVQDSIYLTAVEGRARITLAIDRKTGQIRWRREIAGDEARKIYSGNSPASSTPVSDGTNVYAFFGDFGLVSYAPDGRERWRLKLGPFDSFYGLSGSPVVLDDTVFLVCDQNSGSFVVAVDRHSGRPRWRKDRPAAKTESFSTPVVLAPPGGTPQLIVSGTYRLDAYDPSTGEIIWWVGKQGINPIATPVLGDGVVFASSNGSDAPGYAGFDQLLEMADKNRDGKVAAAELAAAMPDYGEHFGFYDLNQDGFITRNEWDFRRTESVSESGLVAIATGGHGDRSNAQLLWRNKKIHANYSTTSPLLYNGVLYIVKGGGIMTTLNPATGDTYKVGRLGSALGEYFASPVAADGKVYFTNVEGVVTVVKAQPLWEVLSSNDLGEQTQATPAVADEHLYIRTHKALYSFSARPK